MSKEKRKEVRRIFPEISAESNCEVTPHPAIDKCSQVPGIWEDVGVVVVKKRPKSNRKEKREVEAEKERGGHGKTQREKATSQEKKKRIWG